MFALRKFVYKITSKILSIICKFYCTFFFVWQAHSYVGPDRGLGPGPSPGQTHVLFDKSCPAPVYVNLVKPGPAPAPAPAPVLKKILSPAAARPRCSEFCLNPAPALLKNIVYRGANPGTPTGYSTRLMPKSPQPISTPHKPVLFFYFSICETKEVKGWFGGLIFKFSEDRGP